MSDWPDTSTNIASPTKLFGIAGMAEQGGAEASLSPGTAEYLATKLSSRAHACPHFPKIRAGDGGSPIPSRLGFFYKTDCNISFIDTSKLCRRCYAEIAPEGYNAWFTLSRVSKVGELRDPSVAQLQDTMPTENLVDIPPSSEFYPPLFQAGTEGFTSVVNSTAESVSIPVPQVPEAKEAWEWLKAQGKPFYIDRLHHTKGWKPMAVRSAAVGWQGCGREWQCICEGANNIEHTRACRHAECC